MQAWFDTCIWPGLQDLICDIAKDCNRNLSCMEVEFCDLGNRAWGIMADCWLERHTEHLTYADSAYRDTVFPDYVSEQFGLVIQQQTSGDFREACEAGTAAFWSIANNEQTELSITAPPYRGYIYTDPLTRNEGLKIRVPVPYPEEPDPCAPIEQGVSNG